MTGPCGWAEAGMPHGPHDVWPMVQDPETGWIHIGLASVPCPGYRASMTETAPAPEPTVDVPVETPAKEETTVEVPAEEAKAPEAFGYETKENPRS